MSAETMSSSFERSKNLQQMYSDGQEIKIGVPVVTHSTKRFWSTTGTHVVNITYESENAVILPTRQPWFAPVDYFSPLLGGQRIY